MAIYHGNSIINVKCETNDLDLIKRQLESAQYTEAKNCAEGLIYLVLNFWEDTYISNPNIGIWGDSYTYTLTEEEYTKIKNI